MVVKAVPAGEDWAFELTNDSAEVIEDVVVEQVSYVWGDFGNTEPPVNRHTGPILPGQTRRMLVVESSELRTTVSFRVHDASGAVGYYDAEVGRLYPPKPDSEPKLAELTTRST